MGLVQLEDPLRIKMKKIDKILQALKVGDKIETVANVTGIATAVHFLEKKTGRDCGCKKRKAILNGEKQVT